MTTPIKRMPIGELTSKILGDGNTDFLRQALLALLDPIMAVEVEHLEGAGKPERSDDRPNQWAVG